MKRLLAILIMGCVLLTGCHDTPAPYTPPPAPNPTENTTDAPTEAPTQDDSSLVEKPTVSAFETGVYDCTHDSFDTFTIHAVEGDTMSFSVFWYRITSIDMATAQVDGNHATFSWTNPDTQQIAVGTLDILPSNVLIMTLTECTLPYTEPGIYTYQLFGSEEEHSANYMKEILLKNTDTLCWRCSVDTGNIEPTTISLRFNEDGTYTARVIVTLGGDGLVSDYTGVYIVTADTLYLDMQPYEFSAYSTAVSGMSLKAMGEYDLDFSGEYTLS